MYFAVLLFAAIFPLILGAQIPFEFSEGERVTVEKKYSRIAINRIDEFYRKLREFKHFEKREQLLRVNAYINTFLPQYDAVIDHKEEYWKTPKEFLAIGYGDCEDYVILKYFMLIALGFGENKLFFSPVIERYSGTYHMVLLYEKAPTEPPLVLDNISSKVLPLNKRIDLKVSECYNSHGYYKCDTNGKRVTISKHSERFEALLERVRSGQ